MRQWILGILGIATLVIVTPWTAMAALDGPKAKTIDELAAMFDASRCKACHGEIYNQWGVSHHARPLMGVHGGLKDTPLAMAGATPWSPEHPSQATLDTFPCFKCHLPQALTHAEDSVAAEYAQALLDQDRAKIGKLKITCIVCHNNKAIIHRLQEGNPEPHVLYGPRDIPNHPDPVFTEIRQSPVMKEPLFCGQCHGVGVNLEFENPVQCATLYGSYQHAYIPGGGTQSCQECHLYPKHNGFADHRMLPDWNNTELMSQRLSQSISLDMQAMGYEWLRAAGDRPNRLVVETKIDSRAGHRIPDG